MRHDERDKLIGIGKRLVTVGQNIEIETPHVPEAYQPWLKDKTEELKRIATDLYLLVSGPSSKPGSLWPDNLIELCQGDSKPEGHLIQTKDKVELVLNGPVKIKIERA